MKKLFTIFLAFSLAFPCFPATNKVPLQSLINDCQTLLNKSAEGTQNGYYLIGSKQVLTTAVTNATVILNDTSSIQTIVTAEVDSLFSAYTRFTKQRYGIANPNWSDNYWQFSGNSAQWAAYNLHDPSVIKTDGYYYVFSTDAAWAASSAGLPFRRSRDLVNWEFRGWAFKGFPAEPSTWFYNQNTAVAKQAVTGLWAPYIMKVGTQYRLYYSAVFATSGALIGLATSDNIEGPWTQVGKVISTYDLANVNAIDPTVSIDKTGRYWMIYGSWSNGIYCFELEPTTGLKKNTNAPTLIARNGPNNTWAWKSSLEGPEIIYNPKTDKYYLFTAQGSLGNVYHTRVARSANPYGPYYDYFGTNVAYSATSPAYPEIYPLLTYPYQFANHPGWQGVSHVGVYSDGNGDFFMMHQGRPSATPAMMVMHNRKISWTADGWPVISPERYANPGIMPKIIADSIVGNWEEIQLNELKDVGSFAGRVTPVVNDTVSASKFLNTPKTAVYNANGTYTYGTESGSWKLSGDTLITTRLAKAFKGLLSYEYDWENGHPTLVYTGLRYDARSIWGKKSYARTTNNIILNSTFDTDLSNWVLNKAGGTYTEEITTSGITGSSFHAICTTPAANYYSRQMSWYFPVPKCARYKVSFKAKLLTIDTINLEIQDNSSIIPILRTGIRIGTTAATYSFITQDIPVTSNQYVFNIAYGNLTSGNQLWLDDVVVEEVTDRCNGNYITNGNFTDALTGWTNYKATRISSQLAVDSLTAIDAHPSLKIAMTTPSVLMIDAYLRWPTYLHTGSKYVLEFMAKSSTGFNLQTRFLNSGLVTQFTSAITAITGDWTKYRFILPSITTLGTYNTEIDYGKAVAGTSVNISNITLSRCAGDCTQTEYNPIEYKELNIYPNPAKDYFEISGSDEVKEYSIYSIDGKMIRNNQVITSNKVNVSDLRAGSYILKIKTGTTERNRLLLIEK